MHPKQLLSCYRPMLIWAVNWCLVCVTAYTYLTIRFVDYENGYVILSYCFFLGNCYDADNWLRLHISPTIFLFHHVDKHNICKLTLCSLFFSIQWRTGDCIIPIRWLVLIMGRKVAAKQVCDFYPNLSKYSHSAKYQSHHFFISLNSCKTMTLKVVLWLLSRSQPHPCFTRWY